GTISDFDGDNLEKGSVAFTIQTASVDTDDEGRDKHLRNEDFFEVDTYPTMTFKSKSIKADGKNFKLTGDLTIKDVTKEVTFDGTFAGTIDDPWGNKRAGFSAIATIDRKDFGIEFGKVMDNGGLMVGNDVEIMIELETIMEK
ncbi:MAG: polyisoprenoid-binding protein, partial [Calditrichaeota bacterium]